MKQNESPLQDLWAVSGHPVTLEEPHCFQRVGDIMRDGSVYAGVSDKTASPFFTPPTSSPMVESYPDALALAERAGHENKFGRGDWRLPTQGELITLFNNKAKGRLADTFGENGAYHNGWYWADDGSRLHFRDGHVDASSSVANNRARVRLVR